MTVDHNRNAIATLGDRKKRDELMFKALAAVKESAALIAAIDKAASRGTYAKKPKVAATAGAAAAAA